jgi:urate oxidase
MIKHFLNTYPRIVNKVSVEITRDRWDRVAGIDSNGNPMPHKHSYLRNNNAKPYTKVSGTCSGNGVNNTTGRAKGPVVITMQSGFHNLDIMKSTQSGFENFHQCSNTTLIPDNNRFVGTSCDCEWTYDSRILGRKNDYNAINKSIEDVLIQTFVGPADVGIYSPSVQQTLFLMGKAALSKHPTIEKIQVYAPNLHVIAFPTEKLGVPNKDHTGLPDTYFPIDEPHGMIKVRPLIYV